MQKFPLNVLISHLIKMGKEVRWSLLPDFFFLFSLSVVILYAVVWFTVEKVVFSGMTL